jgi:hypothetical protein
LLFSFQILRRRYSIPASAGMPRCPFVSGTSVSVASVNKRTLATDAAFSSATQTIHAESALSPQSEVNHGAQTIKKGQLRWSYSSFSEKSGAIDF